MLLYVWVAGWEFECCQPDAVIGETWGGSLFLGSAEPWWARYAHGALPPEVGELGVTEFDGDVLRPAPSDTEAALIAIGPTRVGVVGATASGPRRFRGRLEYEGHVGPDGVDLDELRCVGTVERVRGISYVYEASDEDEEMPQVPVAQNAPRELRSTGESIGMGGYEFGTYLIDLEVP